MTKKLLEETKYRVIDHRIELSEDENEFLQVYSAEQIRKKEDGKKYYGFMIIMARVVRERGSLTPMQFIHVYRLFKTKQLIAQ